MDAVYTWANGPLEGQRICGYCFRIPFAHDPNCAACMARMSSVLARRT